MNVKLLSVALLLALMVGLVMAGSAGATPASSACGEHYVTSRINRWTPYNIFKLDCRGGICWARWASCANSYRLVNTCGARWAWYGRNMALFYPEVAQVAPDTWVSAAGVRVH